MLISKTIRQKLTVLAIGSSLFAGCSSGPKLSSIRFWPGAEKMESAADDEAVAQKWRDRLNASALSGGYGAAPEFETAKAEEDAAKSRSSRFNIFRRFSRNKEAEAPQTPETADTGLNRDQQRLALERRIAELEAEQRAIQQQRTAAQTQGAGSFDPRQASETSDPFLAASQMNPTAPKKQIVRPAIRPAPRPPAAAADTNLPSWAQANKQNATAAPAPPTRKVAINPRNNTFAPGFDQTLNNLEAAAQRPANTERPQGKAPALPLDTQPAVTPHQPNPFAQMEQKTAASVPASRETAQAMPEKPQPKLDRPVAEPGNRNQLASLRSADEQQRAWAELQVRQLLKRSRIQARAGQLNEALNTAVAAEQLANSADVEFSNHEQTPAQLVSLIRLKAEEMRSDAGQTHNEPKQAIASAESKTNLDAEPATPHPLDSQKVSTKTVAPPQWPGRTAAMPPNQVTGNYHPLVSTPGPSKSTTESDRNLKTADFVHPRPAQSVESYATTSDQWHSADNHPLTKSPDNTGRYMEAPAVPRRSSNEINAQFVSSKTIYSPENLQWTSLDAARATIVEEQLIPAPPVPVAPAAGRQEPPPFQEEGQDAESADPFAGVFAPNEVSDTLLSSDDPLSELGPTIPEIDENAATETSQEMLLFGIPARKLGLVLLAGLILLAAIVHRRRTSELHEL